MVPYDNREKEIAPVMYRKDEPIRMLSQVKSNSNRSVSLAG